MRKAIFWGHLIVGISASLVILVMSATGVLLMYQRQITAWADMRALKPMSLASGQVLSMAELSEAVSKISSTAPTSISIRRVENSPVVVSFGREKTLFLDPFTGQSLGEGSKAMRAFFQSMVELHRWLALKGEWRENGKWFTGAANLGFFFLTISGIYLWWPRSWNARSLRAITVLSWKARGKARDWNWHNVFGLWCALPLAVITFTAIFFSYPSATNFLYRTTGENPPARPTQRDTRKSGSNESSLGSKAARQSLPMKNADSLWTMAKNHVADWKTISLRVPNSPTASWVFTIDQGNGARPDLRGQLTLNPASLEVVSWEGYESQATARKIRTWIRWLHTGEAGGMLGQTIAGLASAGGVLLVWTGLSLAFRRFNSFRQRRNSNEEFNQPQEVLSH
jgi:uncharacterized iron-regulated membrane protein